MRVTYRGSTQIVVCASILFSGCGGSTTAPKLEDTSQLLSEIERAKDEPSALQVGAAIRLKLGFGSGIYFFVNKASIDQHLADMILADSGISGSVHKLGEICDFMHDKVREGGPSRPQMISDIQSSLPAAWAGRENPENAALVLALSKGSVPSSPPTIDDDTPLTQTQTCLLTTWLVFHSDGSRETAQEKCKREEYERLEREVIEAYEIYNKQVERYCRNLVNGFAIANNLTQQYPTSSQELADRLKTLKVAGILTHSGYWSLRRNLLPRVDGPGVNTIIYRVTVAKNDYLVRVAACHQQN